MFFFFFSSINCIRLNSVVYFATLLWTYCIFVLTKCFFFLVGLRKKRERMEEESLDLCVGVLVEVINVGQSREWNGR